MTIACEVWPSLVKSGCAKLSFAEITGNSSERTNTRVMSPRRCAQRLRPSGATQWVKEPTANRSHSKLRDASSVICAQGQRLSEASTVACAQATEQITIGKAARASPVVISRSLRALRTVVRPRLNTAVVRPQVAFCSIADHTSVPIITYRRDVKGILMLRTTPRAVYAKRALCLAPLSLAR